MKALAFRLPQPVGAREDPCRANARRILRNLVGGDARDYGKALSRFQRQAARGPRRRRGVVNFTEAHARRGLGGGAARDRGGRRRPRRRRDLGGARAQVARRRGYFRGGPRAVVPCGTGRAAAAAADVGAPRAEADALAPEAAARSEHDQCAAAVSAFAASGAATPAMLRAVRRAADSSKALDAALARDPCLEKAFEAAAAAPREPRSRRPVTAPPPSPDAPVSETPDSSVPSSPFGASPGVSRTIAGAERRRGGLRPERRRPVVGHFHEWPRVAQRRREPDGQPRRALVGAFVSSGHCSTIDAVGSCLGDDPE